MSKRRLLMILLLVVLSGASSCHIGRFFVWNFADLKDNRKFHQIDISRGSNTFRFNTAERGDTVRLPRDIKSKRRHFHSFDDLLKRTGTTAFLVIRNDTMLYEKYLNGYERNTAVPSFSAAKSVTSMLVGIAIDEGAIHSVNDPVSDYVPELKKHGFDKVTIAHLLNMRAALKYRESYVNPFAGAPKYYYGRNLQKYLLKLRVKGEPGKRFEYQSAATQLLALVVERAVHKSLATYMEEKVWQYIGAEYDAGWSIDGKKHGEVKAFCCFNARPVDYAKIGRLYLHNGNWNGRQIVSEKWVKQSVTSPDGKYHYQWWHNAPDDFFAEGILGQFVYVYPAKHIIIVRLGKRNGINAWASMMRAIAQAN